MLASLTFFVTACAPPLPTLVPSLAPPPTATAAPELMAVIQKAPEVTVIAVPAATATAPPSPTATTPNTATPTATATPPIIHLLFTGDINPGRCPAQRALHADDFTLPYHQVADVLRAADLTIGSLDGTISDQSPPSPCPLTMNLIGPSRTVEGLAFAGFDVMTVATNHAKDCGLRGWNCDDRAFRDTRRHLEAAGIMAVGGGENLAEALAPALVDVHGVRFAFLGVTSVGIETWARGDRPGTAPLSDEALPQVTAAIAAARAQAEVVIVLPQWGVEYTERPVADQLRWAPQLIAAGADLVIGNHPHVVEPVEVFPPGAGSRGGVVAYALGNFVFDQGPWETRQGVVFEAVFSGSTLTNWNLLPVHIYSLHQPDWAPPVESSEILERIEAAARWLPER